MACKVCPLVQAVNVIRGGGLFIDDLEESDNTVVKIGGGDTEFICDDTTYYINTRLIELARFEISRPDLIQCRRKFQRMFAWITTREDVYKKIIDESQIKGLIYQQFINLVELLDKLDSFILAKVTEVGRTGRNLNITVPDILFAPNIDIQIIYNPSLMRATINNILEYMRRLNINALLRENVSETFELLPEFSPVHDLTEMAPHGIAVSTEEYINLMHKMLDFEMETAKYVQEMESYYRDAINITHKVFKYVQKIMENVKIN